MSKPDTKPWTYHRAVMAHAVREGDRDRADKARRDMRAARAEDYARELVAGWPPLTAEQRERIAAILRPSTPDGGGSDA